MAVDVWWQSLLSGNKINQPSYLKTTM